ncbi:MAG TPA: caspase family protein [Candidatus Obscuribacterales bacterium]
MNNIKRRHFLQLASSALATVGISQLDVMRQGDRYSRAIAQTGGRKLALLVGINDYPFGNKLFGCLNDVDLQKNLLIYRFGFQEKDIRILKDNQATRQGILTAFEEHLINQAKPGDVVVFHFSGHGSQVFDADCDFKDDNGNCVNSTFIPFDNNLPFAERQKGGVVNDIMGHTLFLLMYALQTENVTVVLDSCHSGGGKRGNLIVRAAAGGEQLKPSQAEIEYQQQWLRKLNLTSEEYKKKRQEGVPKGVVIASAKREQYAIDAPFNDFNAGAFTYAMTQYLWQQPGNEPLSSAIVNISRNTTEIANNNRRTQEPEWEDKPGSNASDRPIFFLNKTTFPAEAVVTQAQGDTAQLWLGGINSESLQACDDDEPAVFSIIDSQGQEVGQVKLEPQSRQKLEAKGKLIKGKAGKILQRGTLLQERMRPIPKDINLTIGLDPALGNDKTKAEKALQGIKNIQVVPIQQGKEVAYIFGRITNDNQKFQKQSTSELPPVGSIGLFTPALELIPGSFGETDEMVDAAVTRLKSKFKSLIAARLVKTILNTGSSRLNVTASMNRADSDCQTYATVYTVRGSGQGKRATPELACNSQSSLVSNLKLPLGTPVKFKVTNGENKTLYMCVLVIDPEGEITVVFPNRWSATEDAALVEAGETREIPQKGTDKFQFLVAKPLGRVEVLVIASSKPLKETLLALRSIATRGDRSSGPVSLRGEEPAELTRGLRGDLQFDTDSPDTHHLAAMSITFEAIA